jgi:hypothetical protein
MFPLDSQFLPHGSVCGILFCAHGATLIVQRRRKFRKLVAFRGTKQGESSPI